jgi:Flp pilus assembly protein TadG
LCSRFGEDAGQEILEAAIVLPLLFLVLLAVFWFGRVFNISSTVQRAAREAIQTASKHTCATCGDLAQENPQIYATITNALQADQLKTADLVSYAPGFACVATPAPACTTYQNVQICHGGPLACDNASCQPTADCGANTILGIRIAFGYEYTWPLVIANLPAITIHAVAQSGAEH